MAQYSEKTLADVIVVCGVCVGSAIAPTGGCHAPLRSESGNSRHAPASMRRHTMIPNGTSPAATINACCTNANGALTRNTGIANNVRSKVACSSTVVNNPKRRKMSAQIIDGTINSTNRAYEGKPG